jgi:hypothetical protein
MGSELKASLGTAHVNVLTLRSNVVRDVKKL